MVILRLKVASIPGKHKPTTLNLVVGAIGTSMITLMIDVGVINTGKLALLYNYTVFITSDSCINC